MKPSLLLFAALTLFTFNANACIEDYVFGKAIIHELPDGNAEAYVSVFSNTGDTDDAITGAQADWADHIELQENSKGKNNAVKEIPFPHDENDSLRTLILSADSYHILVSGIKGKLSLGNDKDITLSFESGKTEKVPFVVQPVGVTAAQAFQYHADHKDKDEERMHMTKGLE